MSEILTAVIDLDNCISDDAWRMKFCEMHHINPNDRYHKYHEFCDMDQHSNRHIINELSAKYKLVVFTSRPEVVRHKTERWLHKWRVPFEHLFMRGDGDQRPSVPIKREMLLERLPRQYKVEYAIDDRSDILNMYADEGVRVAQRVFIHNPELIHP